MSTAMSFTSLTDQPIMGSAGKRPAPSCIAGMTAPAPSRVQTLGRIVDGGALCGRACYQAVDHRPALDPDLSDPADRDQPAGTGGCSGPPPWERRNQPEPDIRPSEDQDLSRHDQPYDGARQSPNA
jgi:hypothetical protein